METTFFRFATKPGADARQVFNLAQTSVLIITLILSCFFIALAEPIARNFSLQEHAHYITWLVCVVAIDAIVAIPFARLRLEKKATQFALAKIINVLIIVILNFYFLSEQHYNPAFGVAYVFLFNLIGNAFYILFFARTLMQWRPAFNKEVLRAMFQYAYPIMIT